jgi:hypothetical protein
MQRVLVSVILPTAMLALLSCDAIRDQDSTSTLGAQPSISDSSIEQQKLDIERQKLEVERTKASWSAVSTVVPLLAALGTLIYSVWSFRKQTNHTNKLQKESAIATATLQKEAATETAALQNESAKLQFEIKAAEIAFSGKTPEAVINRANVLKTIFGDRLPKDFPPTFDPKKHGGGKESPEEKMFFLELLLKYPGKETEIIEGWEMLFGDSWLDRVKPVVQKKTSTPHKPGSGEAATKPDDTDTG